MGDSPKFMVKISGSPELISALQGVSAASAGAIEVKSAGPAEEPSHLRLGLTDISTIVAIVNGVATFSQFAWAIYQHFKEGKSEEMTVQTPLRTVVIVRADADSPQRVQALLEQSIKG